MNATGSIIAKLGLDSDEFKRGINNAQNSTSGFEKAITGIGAKLLAAFSIGAVAKGLVDNFNVIRKEMDGIAKSARGLGIGIEALQELKFAAGQSGVEFTKLQPALGAFVRKIGEASKEGSKAEEMFRALNISVKDQDGSLKSVESLLGELANAYSGMGNETEKSALLLKLFGEQGAKLGNLFAGGAEGIKALGDQARRAGIIVSEESVVAFERFNDQLAILTQRLKLVGAEVFGDFAEGLANTLESAADRTARLTAETKKLNDAHDQYLQTFADARKLASDTSEIEAYYRLQERILDLQNKLNDATDVDSILYYEKIVYERKQELAAMEKIAPVAEYINKLADEQAETQKRIATETQSQLSNILDFRERIQGKINALIDEEEKKTRSVKQIQEDLLLLRFAAEEAIRKGLDTKELEKEIESEVKALLSAQNKEREVAQKLLEDQAKSAEELKQLQQEYADIVSKSNAEELTAQEQLISNNQEIATIREQIVAGIISAVDGQKQINDLTRDNITIVDSLNKEVGDLLQSMTGVSAEQAKTLAAMIKTTDEARRATSLSLELAEALSDAAKDGKITALEMSNIAVKGARAAKEAQKFADEQKKAKDQANLIVAAIQGQFNVLKSVEGKAGEYRTRMNLIQTISKNITGNYSDAEKILKSMEDGKGFPQAVADSGLTAKNLVKASDELKDMVSKGGQIEVDVKAKGEVDVKTDVQTAMSALSTSIGSLSTAIASNTGAISVLETTVATLNGKLG